MDRPVSSSVLAEAALEVARRERVSVLVTSHKSAILPADGKTRSCARILARLVIAQDRAFLDPNSVPIAHLRHVTRTGNGNRALRVRLFVQEVIALESAFQIPSNATETHLSRVMLTDNGKMKHLVRLSALTEVVLEPARPG